MIWAACRRVACSSGSADGLWSGGAAAKKIEAERASHHTAEQQSSSPQERATRRVSISYAGVDREDAKTIRLYEAFRDAKQQAGENTSQLTLEAFQNFLQRKTDELRSKDKGAKVEFSVSVEDGKVKLKARTDAPAKSKPTH